MNQEMKSTYSKFYNLEVSPFGETPDPYFYYGSVQHSFALKQLLAGIAAGKCFSLLSAEVGTGKTLLARVLLNALPKQTNTALILYPKFNEMELLQAILEEFEVPVSEVPLTTVKMHVDHLNRFLMKSAEQGRGSVLIIDEAQLMSEEALETIRLLTNLETKTQKLLQIVLVAQPEILKTLDRVEMRQLKQRIAVHAKLPALDAGETEKYIKSRIERAGGANFIRFETSAVRLIHQLSSGIPRRINQLCERALRAGEEKRMRLITGNLVKDTFNYKFSFFAKDKTI